MKMTYIMSCVWLDYMIKYFQCKNCVGSSPKTKKCVASFLVHSYITEPTVDTIIDCRFVIFMRKTAVISRFFHLQMHPLSNRPSKQEIRCYRWIFTF